MGGRAIASASERFLDLQGGAMKARKAMVLGAVSALLAGASAGAAALNFTTFVSQGDLAAALSNNATIGFAYAGDRFVGSVYFGANNNQLYQTDLTGHNVQLFGSPIPGASGEIYVSSSLGLGGFPSRDIYAAQNDGVYHITHDGSAGATFVSGLNGGVRGIAFDPYGLYDHDMIVTTSTGRVYRVNNAGTATLLGLTGEVSEGLDLAPQPFGDIPFGTLVVASEGSGSLRAITPGGVVSTLATVPSAEMLSFVPLNLGSSGSPLEGFYAAAYASDIVHAPASDFAGLLGSIVVTGETTHTVSSVTWDGSAYHVAAVGAPGSFPGQPEDGIFVTAAIINPCDIPGECAAAPEPSSIGLIAAAAGALLASRRRRKIVR
jgi:hypothetical protein